MAYNTVAEADAYFDDRLNSSVWDSSSSSLKTKALETAARHIDQLNFRGSKLVSSQVRAFPRDYISPDFTDEDSIEDLGEEEVLDTGIPDDVKYAECEIAIALLDGIDIEQEANTSNIIDSGFGSARMTENATFVPEHLANGIASIVAWRYLKPYLRDPRAISLDRVS